MSAAPPSNPTLVATVAARGLSYIFFAMSLLSVWTMWIIPSVKTPLPAMQDRPVALKARRRSAPPGLPSRTVTLTPIIMGSSISTRSDSRKVSFVESQINRRSKHQSASPGPPLSPVTPVLTESPLSSSSTLVSPGLSADADRVLREAAEVSCTDSDSSSITNASPVYSRLPKLRPSEKGKKSRKVSIDQVQETIPEIDTPRRSGLGGFMGLMQRSATIPNMESDTLSTPSSRPSTPVRRASGSGVASSPPTGKSGCAFKPFKTSAKKASGPVNRTQPYNYPYFALPPGAQPPFLKTPVDSEDERDPLQKRVELPSGNLSAPVIPDASPKFTRKMANAQAQATLGHGRKPPAPTHRRVVSALP
ncbi:hypothetical protein CYLTODRAFT_416930 [Cylindrobasidium torrendii FP15055 ss-10]|uniref:Uncharacterized protein n=1 Tax=Cylindrobasidium torrendii FP15055 ss-10 TaxID=1314674 RepID=A0A0D7BT06_9AGAR|nr:hypothetical protein CYLTODRAFT_416930 [Cylindrobasidium torrendii FP15055 ss-10]